MDPNSSNPLVRLVSSTKSLFTVFVVAASFVALFMGRATWDQVEALVKYIGSAWMIAQAGEDVAKHIAAPKTLALKMDAIRNHDDKPGPNTYEKAISKSPPPLKQDPFVPPKE